MRTVLLHAGRAGVLTLALTSTAFAAPITFTNSATFTTAAAGIPLTTENFNGGPTGLAPITVGQLTMTELSGNGSFQVATALFGTDNSTQWATASGGGYRYTFSGAVNAVGFDIFDLGTVGATTLTYTLSNGGSGTLFTGFSGATGNALFGGVIDTNSFTYIQFANSSTGDFVELDNARFGARAVPEPTTISLFVVGGVLLALNRRRLSAASRR